jgi:hypothetical protein
MPTAPPSRPGTVPPGLTEAQAVVPRARGGTPPTTQPAWASGGGPALPGGHDTFSVTRYSRYLPSSSRVWDSSAGNTLSIMATTG